MLNDSQVDFSDSAAHRVPRLPFERACWETRLLSGTIHQSQNVYSRCIPYLCTQLQTAFARSLSCSPTPLHPLCSSQTARCLLLVACRPPASHTCQCRGLLNCHQAGPARRHMCQRAPLVSRHSCSGAQVSPVFFMFFLKSEQVSTRLKTCISCASLFRCPSRSCSTPAAALLPLRV